MRAGKLILKTSTVALQSPDINLFNLKCFTGCTTPVPNYTLFIPLSLQCVQNVNQQRVLWPTSFGLVPFWSDIFKCFSEVYNRNITPDPHTAIFGGTWHLLAPSHLQQRTIQYGMVIAKRNILTLWKNDDVPSFKTWLAEVTSLFMERVRHNLSLTSATFDKMWQPLLTYLSRMT